jgi:hypothetical protein
LNVKPLVVPLLVLVALAGLAIWGALQKTPPAAAQPLPCADPVAGCNFTHRGLPARVRFSATPETMKAFILTVSHPALQRASASFQMVGMDMGFNRYDLKRGADGNWTARVVLPVCTASRADWVVELKLDDAFYSLPFTSR